VSIPRKQDSLATGTELLLEHEAGEALVERLATRPSMAAS
jgi:hypothetical protein